MLEAEIIHLDFEKVMAVILSVVTQLNVYSVPMTQRAKEEGQEVLDNLKRMTLLERENPIDAINELEYAAYVRMQSIIVIVHWEKSNFFCSSPDRLISSRRGYHNSHLSMKISKTHCNISG